MKLPIDDKGKRNWRSDTENYEAVTPYYFGMIEFGLGNTERAIDYLYKVYDQRDGILIFSGVDPIAESAWSNPRFIELTKKIGLPQ